MLQVGKLRVMINAVLVISGTGGCLMLSRWFRPCSLKAVLTNGCVSQLEIPMNTSSGILESLTTLLNYQMA